MKGVVHYELLEDGRTTITGVYHYHFDRLNQALHRKCHALINGKDVILQRDNVRVHPAKKKLDGKIRSL